MADFELTSLKKIPKSENYNEIYGNMNIRKVFEREILLAERDILESGTPENIYALRAKLDILVSIYKKAKEEYLKL